MTTDKDREEAQKVVAAYKNCALEYCSFSLDNLEYARKEIARIRQEAFDQGVSQQKDKQIADAIARTENALPSQRNSFYAYGLAYGDLDLLAAEVKRLNSEMQTIRQEAKAEALREAAERAVAWLQDPERNEMLSPACGKDKSIRRRENLRAAILADDPTEDPETCQCEYHKACRGELNDNPKKAE